MICNVANGKKGCPVYDEQFPNNCIIYDKLECFIIGCSHRKRMNRLEKAFQREFNIAYKMDNLDITSLLFRWYKEFK